MAITRRSLVAAGAALLPLRAAGTPVRLGGPIFLRSEDPVELAREHRRLGYSAAYCPNAPLADTARLRAIESAFAAQKVVIAEVGAWKNMLDPDAPKRKQNLDYVVERCAVAEAVGARCCVDIAGSYNAEQWDGIHPKNLSKEFFDGTVQNCRHVIDAVKPKRTKFTIEMMSWSLPDGPDSYVELVRAVDRPAFAVHLDVCNIVNSPSRFYGNGELIRECFRKLGRWIQSYHAKDLKWYPGLSLHLGEVIPGRGEIDYRVYLAEVAKLPTAPPLMLEHLKNAQEYDEGRAYIQKVASEIGVTFA